MQPQNLLQSWSCVVLAAPTSEGWTRCWAQVFHILMLSRGLRTECHGRFVCTELCLCPKTNMLPPKGGSLFTAQGPAPEFTEAFTRCLFQRWNSNPHFRRLIQGLYTCTDPKLPKNRSPFSNNSSSSAWQPFVITPAFCCQWAFSSQWKFCFHSCCLFLRARKKRKVFDLEEMALANTNLYNQRLLTWCN